LQSGVYYFFRAYCLAVDSAIFQGHLTYLPVLAKLTAEITANTGDGKTSAAGLEMKERLFLNRVGIGGTDFVIIE
jgi:hypothetical protein